MLDDGLIERELKNEFYYYQYKNPVSEIQEIPKVKEQATQDILDFDDEHIVRLISQVFKKKSAKALTYKALCRILEEDHQVKSTITQIVPFVNKILHAGIIRQEIKDDLYYFHYVS
jgi:hypothetical protein